MELRERIARAISPHLYDMYSEWDESLDEDRETALEIADDVIETLGLSREEERVEPRPELRPMFVPHTVERYVTPWERVDGT